MPRYINNRSRPQWRGGRRRSQLMRQLESRRQADVFGVEENTNAPSWGFPGTNGGDEFFCHMSLSGFVARQVPETTSFFLRGVRVKMLLQSTAPFTLRVMAGEGSGAYTATDQLSNAVDDYGQPKVFQRNLQDTLDQFWGHDWVDRSSFKGRNAFSGNQGQHVPKREVPLIFDRSFNIGRPQFLGAQAPTENPYPVERWVDVFIPINTRFRKEFETGRLFSDPHLILTWLVDPKVITTLPGLAYPTPPTGFRIYSRTVQCRYYWHCFSGLGGLEEGFRGVPSVHAGLKQNGEQFEQYPTAELGTGQFNPVKGEALSALGVRAAKELPDQPSFVTQAGVKYYRTAWGVSLDPRVAHYYPAAKIEEIPESQDAGMPDAPRPPLKRQRSNLAVVISPQEFHAG